MSNAPNSHGNAHGVLPPQALIENHNVVPYFRPGLPRTAASYPGYSTAKKQTQSRRAREGFKPERINISKSGILIHGNFSVQSHSKVFKGVQSYSKLFRNNIFLRGAPRTVAAAIREDQPPEGCGRLRKTQEAFTPSPAFLRVSLAKTSTIKGIKPKSDRYRPKNLVAVCRGRRPQRPKLTSIFVSLRQPMSGYVSQF